MTPEELETVFVQAVLYYCGFTNSDPNRFFDGNDPLELSASIGTMQFNGQDQKEIATWVLAYPSPSNVMLALPDLVDVNAWYNNAYAFPKEVNNQNPFARFSTAQINAMETTEIVTSAIVTNTTLGANFNWNGSTWTTFNSVAVTSKQLTGFVQGALSSLVATDTILQAFQKIAPGGYVSSFHTGILAAPIAFTAGQVKQIPFTVSNHSSNNFTVNTSTGVTTYDGPTNRVKFTLDISGTPGEILKAGACMIFVNVNNQTSAIPATQKRKAWAWASVASLTGAPVTPISLTDTIVMTNGDTFTIGGYLAAGVGQDIIFYDVGVDAVVVPS